MNRLVVEQIESNRTSREIWARATDHRQMVTRLISQSAAGDRPTLGIFGAGNCNDLDLNQLTQRFAAIHLMDLDSTAMRDALVRQNLTDHSSIVLHGPCDVSGVLAQLGAWSPGSLPNTAEVEEALRLAANPASLNVGGPFSVASSVCILSQLLESVVSSLGEQHDRFIDLIRAVRRRHIELLIESTSPGGHGILITDIVSSETAPDLRSLDPRQLPARLANWIAAHNYFHGLNPGALAATFQQDTGIARQVEAVEYLPPWIWDFGARYYAVLAIRFRRRTSTSDLP